MSLRGGRRSRRDRRARRQGVELVDDQPRQDLFGLEVAFVHPDAVDGVLSNWWRMSSSGNERVVVELAFDGGRSWARV